MAIIDDLFRHLISSGGSDLHLSQGHPPKTRIHGSIKPISEEILDETMMETMMREICEPRAWERYREKGDLDFAYEMDGTRASAATI
jgi:twitching motility protein PilT